MTNAQKSSEGGTRQQQQRQAPKYPENKPSMKEDKKSGSRRSNAAPKTKK